MKITVIQFGLAYDIVICSGERIAEGRKRMQCLLYVLTLLPYPSLNNISPVRPINCVPH